MDICLSSLWALDCTEKDSRHYESPFFIARTPLFFMTIKAQLPTLRRFSQGYMQLAGVSLYNFMDCLCVNSAKYIGCPNIASALPLRTLWDVTAVDSALTLRFMGFQKISIYILPFSKKTVPLHKSKASGGSLQALGGGLQVSEEI